MDENNKTDMSGFNLEGLSPYLQALLATIDEPGDFEFPLNSKPDWLDLEKFKRGQKFAMDHLFCINFAEVLSLMLCSPIDRVTQTMIATGRSDTPFKAFQRYLSTVTRVMSWYEGDLWGEATANDLGRRNMAAVNMMHRNVRNKMASTSAEELRQKMTVGDGTKTDLWSTPTLKVVQKDFLSACPVAPAPIPGHGSGPSKHITQFDMVLTQFSFVSLFVTYPERFGVHNASDEDLDAFTHVWRGLGYLLGIQDQYNLCNTDLKTVRQRSVEIIDVLLKPSLKTISSDSEHMTRCLVQGICFYLPINYEACLLYLCDVLSIETPLLYNSLTYWQRFNYRLKRFLLDFTCRFPGMIDFYNGVFCHAVKGAQEASPEMLAKWEKTEFPYMMNVKE